MFDITFVIETLKRHWRLLLVAVIASMLCGIAFSYLRGTVAGEPEPYLAEVTFYVDGHDAEAVNQYNYELDEDYLASDVRRVILSSKVAGEVRAEFGEEVTVKSPYWVNRETKSNIYSHYIYAEVAAPSEEIALAAAQAVAEKALVQIEEQLPVTTMEVVEGPILKTVAGSAANYGVDDLSITHGEKPALDVKAAMVFAFCALCLILVIVLLHDFFVRKIRSPHDVERLLGIPVLGQVPLGAVNDDSSYVDFALVLASRARKDRIEDVALCSVGSGAPLDGVEKGVSANTGIPQVAMAVELSGHGRSIVEIASVECLVLVIQENAASSEELRKASELLQRVSIPVLGALYVGRC